MHEFDVAEEFFDLRSADVFGIARDDQREHDIFLNRPLFDQFVVLENDPDMTAEKIEF